MKKENFIFPPRSHFHSGIFLSIFSIFISGLLFGQTPENGSSISGSISTIGEIDSWSLSLKEGETLRVGIGVTSGSGFEPLLELFDSQDNLLTSNGGNSSADLVYLSPSDGVYRVTLREWDNTPDATATYQINFLIPGRSFVVSSGDEGGRILSGSVTSGNIGLGDMDAFEIRANAGEVIRLAIGETSGANYSPFLLLYGPDGTFLTSNGGNNSTDIAAQARTGGDYLVVVQDWNSDIRGSGSYNLYLAVTGQTPVIAQGDEGGLLKNGQRVSGMVALGDSDVWEMEVEAGETIRLGVGRTSGNLSPYLILYGPDGAFLVDNGGINSTDLAYATPVGGTYQVVVQDWNTDVSGSGTYNLYLSLTRQDITLAAGDEGGLMTNGQRVSGTINLGDHDDWFFDADAGETIRLGVGETSGTSLSPFLILYGPDGRSITSNGGINSADVVARATTSGRYRVVVQDWNTDISGSGSYNLYLALTKSDFSVSPGDEGGEISGGERVSGTVARGDMDLWEFDAVAGRRIRLGVGETGATSFFPLLILYGPDGELIGSNAGASSADVSAVAPRSGRYLAVVQDGNTDLSGSGTYNLYLALSGEQNLVPLGDQGGEILSGETKNGSIQLGDHDMWFFSGSAGDTVTLTLTENSVSSFFPALLLYRPDGSFVANDWGSASAALSLTLDQGGEHLVIVQDWNTDVAGSGEYGLELQLTDQAFSIPTGGSNSIQNGQSPDGSIGVAGDSDKWTIQADAGETVWIQVGERSGSNFEPELRVFDPAGQLVARDVGANSATVNFVSPSNATYTAVVSEEENIQTGTYEIFVATSSRGFVTPANDQGGLVPNGESREGSLGTGDMDLWEFDAQTGDPLFLQIGETSGSNFEPTVFLFDPNGDLVSRASGAQSASVMAKANMSGRFRAMVREAEGSASGSYRLHWSIPKDGFSTPALDEGGLIVNGSETDGSISVGDMDLWEFSAEQGDAILLQVGESGGSNFEPEIILYSPNGEKVAQSSGANSASITHVASVSGSYFVIVREEDTDNSGTYRLHFTIPKSGFSVPALDQGGTMNNGEVKDAAVSVADLDTWEFHADEGDWILLRVGETSGSNFEPLMRVFGPSGKLIGRAAGASNASLGLRALSSGLHRVVLQEADSSQSGTCRLHLFRAGAPFFTDPLDEGGSVEQDGSVTGNLGLGDIDPFGFHAGAGEEVVLEVTEISGSNFEPAVTVFGPSGEVVAISSGTQNATVSFIAVETGRHVIVVGEAQGSSSGVYRFDAIQVGLAPLADALVIRPTGQLAQSEISWPSPSTGWILQKSESLLPGTWENVSDSATDNGFSKTVVVDHDAESRSFFRLVKP